jgi:NitT/TauT family transport system substrate-binding protein
MSRWAQILSGGALLWSLACANGRAPSPAAAPATSGPGATAERVTSQTPQAASSVEPAVRQAPAKPAVVRLGNTQGLAGGLQIAVERGYFQEQGIELKQEEFNSTTEIVPPLTTGQLDAGSTTPNASLFNALARGIRITLALAGSEVQATSNGFPLVTRVSPDGAVIRQPSDLRGKRMGQALRGVINEWALDRVLNSVGLRLEDVEIVVMPFPDQVTALGVGQLDGAIFPEPFGTIAETRKAGAHVLDADPYIPGGQVALMSFSEKFAQERPDVARGWAVGYLKGVRDYMDALEYGRDRETIIALLAQSAHIDPRIVEKAGYFPVRRDGHVNLDGMQTMLDWLVEHGYVTQKPEVAPLIDNSFADYAAQMLDAMP